MPKVAIIKGTGSFSGDVEVHYPIYKLVLFNKQGNSLEIKLDKLTKKMLPFMFNLVENESDFEDDNGNVCKLYTMEEIE